MIHVNSRFRAVAFLSVTVFAASLLAEESLRVGVAALLARSFDVACLERAVQMDPANPSLHCRLGSYYLGLAEDSASPKAVREFRLAAELSPLDTAAWSGLAEACEAVEDHACANRALARTLKLSPMTPRLYWQAGLDRITTGRPQQALPYFRRLLELDSQYDTAVFRVCPWSLENADFVLNGLLPASRDATLKVDYINYLSAHGKDDLASIVWARLVASRPSFALSSAAPFLESLLSLGRVRAAKGVWEDLARLGIIQAPPGTNPEDLVFNGGFERAPLGLGFDWRIQASPGVFVRRQTGEVYRGKYSMRVDFAVPANDDLEPVYQLVPVVPSQTYRLTAYERSDSITSASGPTLRVVDPFCPACLDQAMAPVTGSTPWHNLSMAFSTGPKTRLIQLSVWRPHCRSFPSEITGTFWLDSVSIILETYRHPLAIATQEHPPGQERSAIETTDSARVANPDIGARTSWRASMRAHL